MKSIKTKLILSVSALIIFITLIMGIIFLESGYRALNQEAEKSLKLMATEGAKLTQNRMETLISTLEIIAKRQEIEDMSWEVDLNILKEELAKTSFLDIGYVLPNGYAYYSDGTVSLMKDRSYVKDGLKGKAEMSDVIISRVTHRPEIEICVPVHKNGKTVGALIARNNADTLGQITKDAGYGNGGFAFMINSEGRVIASPDSMKVIKLFNPIKEAQKDKSLNSLAKAYQSILKEQTGVTSFRQDGNNYFTGFAPILGTDWYFATTADKQEVFSVIPGMIRTIIMVMIIVILLGVGLVYLIELSITRPLIRITNISKQIAELNLRDNISAKYINQKDEIGTLSKTFQTLMDKLREMITKINESANHVSAAAQELTAASLQSAQISEVISGTVESIAKGAAEQASNTKIGSDNVGILGNMIEKNRDQVINLNTVTMQVNGLVSNGLEVIDRLSQSANENKIATDEICEIIAQTKKSSEQIRDASKMISEMAKQTNLVALNASIEAARAGEAGKGFSVVADEIQKMADQSAMSTKIIDDIIQNLLNNVNKSSESINRIMITSSEQQKSVSDTIGRYQMIADSMKISEDAVNKLNDTEKEMENAKNEILAMLVNLSAIAEQNAAGTQQAASYAQEQTVSSRALADTSSRMSDLAVKLQDIIDRFQI